jgi:hypothetical protein
VERQALAMDDSEGRRRGQSKRGQSGRSTLGCARPSTEHAWASGLCEILFGDHHPIDFLALAILSFPSSFPALCVFFFPKIVLPFHKKKYISWFEKKMIACASY